MDKLLVGAKLEGSGVELQVYDDGSGPVWVHRNSIGISGVARATTWEDAYSICEDEFFPDCEETEAELIAEFGQNYLDDPCFVEQYGFRNSTGGAGGKRKSIVYQKDLNGDSLDRLTDKLAAELRIVLEWQEREWR